MISIKNIQRFCKEDPSLIENYDKAIADTTQIWDCHHRLEVQGNEVHSMRELKESGLYYHRPACELIFLTHSEHSSLHNKGENNSMYQFKYSEQTRKKMSESHKGKTNPNKGKHLSEETKNKIAKSHIGVKRKPHSEETKRKISESQRKRLEKRKECLSLSLLNRLK